MYCHQPPRQNQVARQLAKGGDHNFSGMIGEFNRKIGRVGWHVKVQHSHEHLAPPPHGYARIGKLNETKVGDIVSRISLLISSLDSFIPPFYTEQQKTPSRSEERSFITQDLSGSLPA